MYIPFFVLDSADLPKTKLQKSCATVLYIGCIFGATVIIAGTHFEQLIIISME
jgi:hypothetical protein